MTAINTAPGRELPPPPWPRLRPAVGVMVALCVIGYYGSKIGEETTPYLVIDTDAEITEAPIAEFVVEASTPRDFQVVVRTGVCTTAEFEWEGPGSKGSAVNDVCVNSHILSPPPGEILQPDSEYLLTATFTSADGVKSSFEHRVSTGRDT